MARLITAPKCSVTHTVLQNGKNAVNGFEALKDLDFNGNGKFDAEDEAWSQVKVWRDANTNGIVDSGELLTLEQAPELKVLISNMIIKKKLTKTATLKFNREHLTVQTERREKYLTYGLMSMAPIPSSMKMILQFLTTSKIYRILKVGEMFTLCMLLWLWMKQVHSNLWLNNI